MPFRFVSFRGAWINLFCLRFIGDVAVWSHSVWFYISVFWVRWGLGASLSLVVPCAVGLRGAFGGISFFRFGARRSRFVGLWDFSFGLGFFF